MPDTTPPRRLPRGAAERAVAAAMRDPRLVQAALALVENRIPAAEQLLREHLKVDPIDVAAIRMLGEVAARIGRYRDSENLLRRAPISLPCSIDRGGRKRRSASSTR